MLGEITYRMQTPLSEGRFAEAVDSGVHVFANAVAEKIGFKVAELESSVAASNSEVVATDSPQSVLVSAKNVEKTRPRVVSDVPKAVAQATPPADPEPTPTETPAAEPKPTESPNTEPKSEPKSEPSLNRSRPSHPRPKALPHQRTSDQLRRAQNQLSDNKSKTPVVKKTAAEIAEEELDELEEVELTLTKPLPERAVKLKEFLDTHPNSKARPRAVEL